MKEKYLKKYCKKVGWDYISMYQKLSEEFIRAFQYKDKRKARS